MSGRETVLFLSDGFYRWDGTNLLHILETIALPKGDCVATTPNRFTYIDNGRLYETDIETSATYSTELTRADNKTSIRPYTKNWIVANRWGYADKSLDIAQFLNFKEGTGLSMPFGSLGKYDVRDLFLHPDGYTVILSGENVLIKIENLIDLLSSKKKRVFPLALFEEKNSQEGKTEYPPEHPFEKTPEIPIQQEKAEVSIPPETKPETGFIKKLQTIFSITRSNHRLIVANKNVHLFHVLYINLR